MLPVHAAPSLQDYLFVGFNFSKDTEFKQNSQKWPWQRGRLEQTRSDAGRLGRSLTLITFAISNLI